MNETIKLANRDSRKREHTTLGVFTPEVRYFSDSKKGTFIDLINGLRNSPPSRPTTTPPPQRSNPLAFPNVVYRETKIIREVSKSPTLWALLIGTWAGIEGVIKNMIILKLLPAAATAWAPPIAAIALGLAVVSILYNLSQMFGKPREAHD